MIIVIIIIIIIYYYYYYYYFIYTIIIIIIIVIIIIIIIIIIINVIIIIIIIITVNPLYTVNRYDKKLSYNDNESSLKRWQYMKICKNIVFDTSRNICFGRSLNQKSETYVAWEC